MKPGDRFRVSNDVNSLADNGIPAYIAGTIRLFGHNYCVGMDEYIVDTENWMFRPQDWKPIEQQLQFAFMKEKNVKMSDEVKRQRRGCVRKVRR